MTHDYNTATLNVNFCSTAATFPLRFKEETTEYKSKFIVIFILFAHDEVTANTLDSCD